MLGSCCLCIHLCDLVLGSCETDCQALDFAEPPFFFGLRNSIDQVVPDPNQPGPLCGIESEHGAADAGFSELRRTVQFTSLMPFGPRAA